MGISSRIKRRILDVASIPMMKNGYRKTAARKWIRSSIADYRQAKQHELCFYEIYKIHRQGYNVEPWINASVKHASQPLTPRDYLRLYPFNPNKAWMRSRLAFNKRLGDTALPRLDYFCKVELRDNDISIVRSLNYPRDLSGSIEGIVELIAREGSVRLIPLQFRSGKAYVLSVKNSQIFFRGLELHPEELPSLLVSLAEDEPYLISPCQACLGTGSEASISYEMIVRYYLGKDTEGSLHMLDAVILDEELEPSLSREALTGGFDMRVYRSGEAIELSDELFERDYSNKVLLTSTHKLEHAAQAIKSVFEQKDLKFYFIALDVGLYGDKIDVLDFHRTPLYPNTFTWSERSFAFLKDQLANKDLRRGLPRAFYQYRKNKKALKLAPRMRRNIRRIRAFRLRSQGFTGRMAVLWTKKEAREKRRAKRRGDDQSLQALSWGFLPATFKKFKITEANRDAFISEREYHYAYPVNGKYGKWVRDRISALEIFEPYLEHFEPAHFHVMQRHNELQIIPLSELAKQFPRTLSGFIAFLEKNGNFILTPSAWKAKRAWKLSSEKGLVQVGKRVYTEDEFGEYLLSLVRKQFLVLVDPFDEEEHSPVNQMPELRVLLINESGANPRIAEAAYIEGLRVSLDELVAENTPLGFEGENLEDQPSEDEISDLSSSDGEGDSSLQGDSLFDDFDEEFITREVIEPKRKYINFESKIDLKNGSYKKARAVIRGKLYELDQIESDAKVFEGKIPNWDLIQNILLDMARFVPQLKFVEFSLVVAENKPVIIGISPYRNYPQRYPFESHTVEFLKRHIERKSHDNSSLKLRIDKAFHNAKLRLRKNFAEALYPKGLVPYQSVRWLGDMRRDFFERTGVSIPMKFWAYRNGFLSYRLPQYGITKENREQFVSDFEYRWIRHINKKYRYWLEDKITIKYIATRFSECFPDYYFYTTWQDGKSYVVPMMDCPKELEASFAGILQLAREKGILALKPDEGSHGEGFYRLMYTDGNYMLNGDVATEQDVLAVLSNPANRYLITEYIQMHPQMAAIYPDAVNTIRMIVFKPDGVKPIIGNAYIRIGSTRSGYVDNLAAGGLLAEIDAETGRYFNGQYLDRGVIHYISHHPDTGAPLEGQLPNWEYAKSKVLEIAESIQQLEFFGFDLALTEDGFKMPEINRSPDYPRIDKLTPETTEYILEKIRQKKRAYGYDKKPPRKLISLPKRSE